MNIDFMLEVFKNNKDKTAIVHKDKEYSYQWLLNSYQDWKNYLDDNNIVKNSVVALRSDFTPYSIGLLLALIENDSIFVPLSLEVSKKDKFLDIAEVEYYINLEKEVSLEVRNSTVEHEVLLKLKNKKHPGLILFSSGSTGEPKAAVHDLIPLMNKYKSSGKALKTITFLLFDHIGGFNTLMYILSNAGTLVAPTKRTPEEICRLIEKYEVELLPTSPSFINMLLFSRAYKNYDISSLNLVTYGTEPMPEATLKEFNSLFSSIRLKQTYGLTEVGIMKTKSESSDSLWLKVGGEDYETKIVEGKLWIKSESAMLGYLNASSPFDENGWLNTGDEVEKKGDYIRFLGRESEIINVGGEKVYPAEVESEILKMDIVKDAIVYGESNPIMGNVVIADVAVSRIDNNKKIKNQIKKYCRKKLEKYKVPVKINLTTKTFNNDRFKRIRKN
jgi:acyl-coenzyme A synthetase/AMP-(fatty) acid ligase